MGTITWIVGPDVFQRSLYLSEAVGGRQKHVLSSPADRVEVDNWLRGGSLIPQVKVLIDPTKFNRQDDYPEYLAGYDSDLIIISEDSFYALSGAFYKKLAKVADVKKCEYFKEYTDDLVNFVQDHSRRYGLTLSGVVADYLVDVTGGDLWHIDSELKKLSYISSMPTLELVQSVCFEGGGFSVDVGDLVRGNWRHFAIRSAAIEPWQVVWRTVEYLVRLLEFHQIYKLKGSLQGGRVPPRMVPKYESELRYCRESKVVTGLQMSADMMSTLHSVESRAFVYYNIARWMSM